eukprot:gene10417-biopygen124
MSTLLAAGLREQSWSREQIPLPSALRSLRSPLPSALRSYSAPLPSAPLRSPLPPLPSRWRAPALRAAVGCSFVCVVCLFVCYYSAVPLPPPPFTPLPSAERSGEWRGRRGAESGGSGEEQGAEGSGERRGAESGGSGGEQGAEGAESGRERRAEGAERDGERRGAGSGGSGERRGAGSVLCSSSALAAQLRGVCAHSVQHIIHVWNKDGLWTFCSNIPPAAARCVGNLELA